MTDIGIPNFKPSTLLDNRFAGPCIVVGSGPSSKILDTFQEWRQFFSIGCNWAGLRHKTDLLAWTDEGFLDRAKDDLPRDAYNLLICGKSHPIPDFAHKIEALNLKGFRVLRKVEDERPSWLTTRSSELITTRAPISGVVALSMAYCMGFDPIIAVGFDASHKSYQYAEPHPVYGMSNQRAAEDHAPWQYEFLKRHAKEMRIVNCSNPKATWGGEGWDHKPFYANLDDYLCNLDSHSRNRDVQRKRLEAVYLGKPLPENDYDAPEESTSPQNDTRQEDREDQLLTWMSELIEENDLLWTDLRELVDKVGFTFDEEKFKNRASLKIAKQLGTGWEDESEAQYEQHKA